MNAETPVEIVHLESSDPPAPAEREKLPPKVNVTVTVDHLQWISDAVAVLSPEKKYDETLGLALLAMQIQPKWADPHLWAGIAFRGLVLLDKAEMAFRDCIKLCPDSAIAHANLGSLLLDVGPLDEGMEHLETAMRLDPSLDYPVQNYMIGLLTRGDLERGWNLYARRLRFPKLAEMVSRYNTRAWDGVRPERVMIVGEEGPGERVMYASMVPDMIAAGATPHFEMNGGFRKFAPLFKRSFPRAVICEPRDEPYPMESQIVAGDLGGFFRRDMGSFPKHGGFLKADATKTAAFRKRLSPAPVVGLSWFSQGTAGRFKSVPLEHFKPVLDQQGTTFVSLQYGDTMSEQLATAPLLNHFFDVDTFEDIDGLAAMVAACDLVITISNITAHIAGGLGVPCWLILPRQQGSMWFWFRDRVESPWYPSIKIYREAESGWAETLKKVGADLGARQWPVWKQDNTA